jgi:speckle-type POZ protein
LNEHYPETITASLEGQPREMNESNTGHWGPAKWTDVDLLTRTKIYDGSRVQCLCLQMLIEFSSLPHPETSCAKGQKQLLANLAKLYYDRSTADVTFIIQEQEVKAHSVVLSLASPVFAAMFHKEHFKESLTSRVVIKDIEPFIFERLLEYIYTGVNFSSSSEPLLQAADKYQISSLKEDCEDALIKKLKLSNSFTKIVCLLSKKWNGIPETISMTEEALHYLLLAHIHSAPKLLEVSLEIIVSLKEDVWNNPLWKDLGRNYHDLFFLAAKRMSENCCHFNK